MAFVCPPKEDSDRKSKLIGDLKNVVDEIEKNLSVSAKPICVPCCIPVCDIPCVPCCVPKKEAEETPKDSPNTVLNPPDVMVCYKVCRKAAAGTTDAAGAVEPEVHRVRQSRSRELRASILYTGCDCEKRDGLQDDCQRTGCHGSPECLTCPPTCGPSEFSSGKHLGRRATQRRSKSGGGNGKGGVAGAKYKCFAAVIGEPVCCPCDPA